MTAEEHNKTLGTLYLIYGAMHGLTLIGLLLLVLVVKLATPTGGFLSSSWIAAASIIFIVLLLFVGLFPVIVGIGFRRRRLWVRPIGFGLAIVSLVNVPIGTALGIYTVKFFRSEGGTLLYGGKARAARDDELQDALERAQPFVGWADRLKQ